ncbi:hypothetical protein [Massilia psychrophila]|nr:hypothetical protein [Massilia psychrophila]
MYVKKGTSRLRITDAGLEIDASLARVDGLLSGHPSPAMSR